MSSLVRDQTGADLQTSCYALAFINFVSTVYLSKYNSGKIIFTSCSVFPFFQ